MWKIFFLFITLYKIYLCDEVLDETLFEYDGECKSNLDPLCFPYKNSFINDQLK
jgi:hypothetical protein